MVFMGGLRKYMLIIGIIFFLGIFFFCGIFLFVCFWLKDEIIIDSWLYFFIFGLIFLVMVGLIVFYMFCIYFLIFEGDLRVNLNKVVFIYFVLIWGELNLNKKNLNKNKFVLNKYDIFFEID